MKKSTVKELFAGKFNHHYVISKVSHDFNRLCLARSPFKFHHALIDFSIGCKHLAEWHWYEELKNTKEWKGKTKSEYLESLKKSSAEYVLISEIADTFKHHTRNSTNKIIHSISLRSDHDNIIVVPEILADCLKWSFGDKVVNVLPVVETKRREHYRLISICRTALNFWNLEIYKNKTQGDSPKKI